MPANLGAHRDSAVDQWELAILHQEEVSRTGSSPTDRSVSHGDPSLLLSLLIPLIDVLFLRELTVFLANFNR